MTRCIDPTSNYRTRIIRGATFRKVMTFTVESTGDPIDLTGATFTGSIWKGDTEVALTFTIAEDPTTGVVTMEMTDENTATLELGVNYIKVELEYSDGRVDVPLYGTVNVIDIGE